MEEKNVIPVFEYVRIVSEEGYDWLEKGSRLYYSEEYEAYHYNYEVVVMDEQEGSSFRQEKIYILSIEHADNGVKEGIFEYGGELVTDTEFIENGE